MYIFNQEENLDSERNEERTKEKFVLILLEEFDSLKQGNDEAGELSTSQVQLWTYLKKVFLLIIVCHRLFKKERNKLYTNE